MNLNLDPDLMEAAVFGKEVELFFQGTIGDYLVKRCKEQSETAMNKLKDIDPFDTAAVAGLQMTIKVADSILIWLADAIERGYQARAALEEMQ